MHRTAHETVVDSTPEFVYDLIADVAAWPAIFPPTLYAERIDGDERNERIRIWATANDQVKSWTSRRELDREQRRVTFRQEASASPVAEMTGQWILTPGPDGGTHVRLLHDFRADSGDPAATAWIEQAVDRNSTAELAALKAAAERRDDPDGALLVIEDVVMVDADGDRVYDFLYEAARWSERLPHVARSAVTEEAPDVQTLEMDTRSPDGSLHTTRSIRICLPRHRIAYKQLLTPALMAVHTGGFTVEPAARGCTVTATHTVALRPEAVLRVLGEGATVADARAFVRNALSRNSTATMLAAKAYAERASVARA